MNAYSSFNASLDAALLLRIRRVLGRFERDPSEVDDLVQEALYEALKSLHSYDGRAPIRSWFAGVAANVARHHVARKVRERSVIVPDLFDELPDGESDQCCPDFALSNKQLLAQIERAMAGLTDELRDTFEMACVQERTYAEVADALGVPVGTVRSRVNRARELIRRSTQQSRPGRTVAS
jgi:RNA polymerase sigma factor (sigma-70 family)